MPDRPMSELEYGDAWMEAMRRNLAETERDLAARLAGMTFNPSAYPGAIACRDLDDGRVIVLYRLIFNDRVCVGPQHADGYDRGFCFPHDTAWDALITWDGDGDPPGPWIKEAGTDRYRDRIPADPDHVGH